MTFQNIAGRLVDVIFGYDFFVSYTWADGSKYAHSLYEKLKAQGFTVFLDEEEYARGDNWTLLGRRALRKTRQLVLVATPRVHESGPVLKELTAFESTGRRIIPIEIGDSLDLRNYPESPLLPLIPAELLKINQPLQEGAIPNEAPAEVVRELRRGFKHVRQAQIRVRVLLGACLVLLGLLSIAVWQGITAELQRRKAEEQTRVTRETLARSDFQQGSEKLDQGEMPTAFAYLARAVRDGQHHAAAVRLLMFLQQRTWCLPVVALEHPDKVWEAHFSPDGTKVVTVSGRKVRLFDADSGARIGAPIESAALRAVRFSRDGRRLLIVSGDDSRDETSDKSRPGAVQMWEITASRTGSASTWEIFEMTDPVRWSLEKDGTMKFFRGLTDAHFSPDGKFIVTASLGGTAQLWDFEPKSKPGGTMLHGLRVNSAEFSSDETRIVTASNDGTARVWKIVQPEARNPGAETLAWADMIQSRDDVRDGDAVTQELRPRGTSSVQVEGNEGSSARLLSADGSERSPNRLKHQGRINSAEFSHGGRRIATTSEDKTARIWDAESGDADGTAFIHPAGVEFARFSRDDQKLITACTDGLARVWDIQSHAEMIPSLRHNAAVSFADFSPDGRHLVTASKDKTTRVWSAETGSPEAKPMVHEHEVVYAQFSPDASLLVTIAKHWFSPNVMAQVIRVWDAVSGDPVSDPIPLTDEGDDKSDGPAFAKFSEDGRWLLITAGTKRIWFDTQVDSGSFAWLANFAEIAGGLKLNEAGGIANTAINSSALKAIEMEVVKYSSIGQESRRTTSPSAPEKAAATKETPEPTEAALFKFIEEYTKSGEQDAPEDEIKFYATTVENYFGKKNVKAAAILADRKNQIRHWPQRNYFLTEPQLIGKEPSNVFLLSAKVHYHVRNPKSEKSSTGVAETNYKVRVSENRLELLSVEEKGTTER
jgi:WD40 repeat protein